jgi:hypothetical protein
MAQTALRVETGQWRVKYNGRTAPMKLVTLAALSVGLDLARATIAILSTSARKQSKQIGVVPSFTFESVKSTLCKVTCRAPAMNSANH